MGVRVEREVQNEWPASGLVLGAGQTGLGSGDSKKEALAPGGPYTYTPPLTHTHTHTHPPRAAPLPTCDGWFLILSAFEVFLHQLGCDTDHVLALPVLDHVEGLEGADDVILSDARHLATQTD